ncbi:MAG: M23 family metallopeptidase [Spirochaetes bacterium]|nr:M23 family metallopeptidase [Spirochaetota bacterium]
MKTYKALEKKFFNTIYEFFLKVKSKTESKWKEFIRKGNEKLTIMLIPHNHKKIKNIHLSNFTLAFFIIFIIIIIILVFISISRLSIYSQEVSEYKIKLFNAESDFKNLAEKTKNTYFEILKLFNLYSKISKSYRLGQFEDVENAGGIEINPDEIANISSFDQANSIFNKTLILQGFYKEIYDRREALAKMAQWIPSRHPFYDQKAIITSTFGTRRDPFNGLIRFHSGLDLNGGYGAPIVATADGIVTFAGSRMGYGLCIIISHTDGNRINYGYSSLYGHLSYIAVRKDQYVRKGQIIGKQGQTGRATGSHLHYEILVNGNPINPAIYLFFFTNNF